MTDNSTAQRPAKGLLETEMQIMRDRATAALDGLLLEMQVQLTNHETCAREIRQQMAGVKRAKQVIDDTANRRPEG